MSLLPHQAEQAKVEADKGLADAKKAKEVAEEEIAAAQREISAAQTELAQVLMWRGLCYDVKILNTKQSLRRGKEGTH